MIAIYKFLLTKSLARARAGFNIYNIFLYHSLIYTSISRASCWFVLSLS